MAIPTVSKVNEFDENLDSAEEFMNSLEETFTTRIGLTRETVTGVINNAVQRPIVPFNPLDSYPDNSVWVEQPPTGGQIYRPKPSALPIAAGPFNLSQWVWVSQRPASVDSYSALDGLLSAGYSDGKTVSVTELGIAGLFVARTGAHTADVGTVRTFGDAPGRYWERLEKYPTLASWFGLKEGASDSTAAITALNNYIKGNGGEIVINVKGLILTDVSLSISACNNVTVRGIDGTDIRNKNNTFSLLVGDNELRNTTISLESQSQTLTANLVENGNSITVPDASGYAVGQWVLVFGGTSINSSGTNRIPTRKQWFRIRAISGNTISFIQQSRYEFLTADDARLFDADKEFVGTCTIENITFSNDNAFTGPYGHFISGARIVTLRNCNLSFFSAAGVSTFVDQTEYINTSLTGYNGFSFARGTQRVFVIRSKYEQRYTSPEGQSCFFEETPELVCLEECELEGSLTFTSTGDNPGYGSTVRVRGGNIKSDGVAILAKGYSNSKGFSLDVDRLTIDCPGSVGIGGNKTVIDMVAFDSLRVTNTIFKNADSDAYAISGATFNPASAYSQIWGNGYGDSLGVKSDIPQGFYPGSDLEGDLGESDRRFRQAHAFGAYLDKIVMPFGDGLTISSGEITVTQSAHTVDTEGGASSDDLVAIDGFEDGMILQLKNSSPSRPITLLDGSGNLALAGNFTLSGPRDTIVLKYYAPAAVWEEISRSPNA